MLRDLAAHFGESWWQEVALLLLALEDPSLFEPYMSEAVKLPAFAQHPEMVDACLDDAAETSLLPFIELLNETGGDPDLRDQRMRCIGILKVLPMMVEPGWIIPESPAAWGKISNNK